MVEAEDIQREWQPDTDWPTEYSWFSDIGDDHGQMPNCKCIYLAAHGPYHALDKCPFILKRGKSAITEYNSMPA